MLKGGATFDVFPDFVEIGPNAEKRLRKLVRSFWFFSRTSRDIKNLQKNDFKPWASYP